MSSSKRSPSLKQKIIQIIKEQGPISIFDYMEMALADTEQGYYRIKDPLGQAGDFTTAPEISQVFGELIGAWFLNVWDINGRSATPQLIELGPGRGTLMNDILRTSKVLPHFLNQASLHFVETSPALRKKQQDAVKAYNLRPQWYNRLADVNLPSKDSISLLVANEFLDALPVRHFIKQGQNWHERCVDITAQDALCFTVSKTPCVLPAGLPHTPSLYQEGDIIEYRPAHQTFIQQLEKLGQSNPFYALIIDYGYTKSQPGETFQALKSHRFTDPLLEPGHADLTAHVDFEDLKVRAEAHDLKVYTIMTQGQFLMSLGLAQRTQQLLNKANKDEAQQITTGAQRLVDPTQMGQLFKVMVIASPHCPVPPPFET